MIRAARAAKEPFQRRYAAHARRALLPSAHSLTLLEPNATNCVANDGLRRGGGCLARETGLTFSAHDLYTRVGRLEFCLAFF
jgi:hypothetical protein